MFCVTMWPLFNLSLSGGGLPVGAGLGRRQPPRGAAGRGQQWCPVLVLLRHEDVQGGPGAGQTQRRTGSRQVTAHAHTPSHVWKSPPDCCCTGGSGGWRGAASGVAKQAGSCPAPCIVSQAACSLCGTGRACCGSDAACPTAFLPVCPAPCRAGGSQIRLPASGNPCSPLPVLLLL